MIDRAKKQTPLLEARDLWYDYEGVAALAGGSLCIFRGANLALLGHNGSGKSTLFFHLNGTLRPSRGEVVLDGGRVGYGRVELAAWRRRVGLVLQNPDDQLFAATVGQDVSFGPLNLGMSAAEAKAAVAAALDALDIADLADRSTHRLSFGQKKRAALAGALAMSPDALLLDEPTAGLDSCGVDELLDALNRLKDKGVTIVVATHDVDFAWRWADDAAVLYEGKVTASGSIDEIFRADGPASEAGIPTPQMLSAYRVLAEKGLVDETARPPRTPEELSELL